MKKLELLTIVSVLIIAAVLACIKIAISTLITTGGAEYSQIAVEKTALEKENIVLREKILNDSSYLTIASHAQSLGFTYDNKARLTMSDPAPIAYKQ